MFKTCNGKGSAVRALAAVVILAAGTSMLAGCMMLGMPETSSTDFPQTAHWDAEKGQYVTERNPNYNPWYNHGSNRGD